jgi:hypothetical protein
MALSIALTALFLAVPSFLLSVYNTMRGLADRQPEQPYNPVLLDGNLNALQGPRQDLTAGSAQNVPETPYSFGIDEDNF